MPRIANELPRGEFFAGLFVLGCVSGLASRIVQSINRLGWADALFNTFEISAIVWISCAAGISLVYRDRTIGVRSPEIAIGLGFIFLVVLPIGPLSWLAVTGTQPLHYFHHECCVVTTRRGYTASCHRAHALEPTAISVFCQRHFANRRIACWLDVGHASSRKCCWIRGRFRGSCNPARLFVTRERVSCIPVLGHSEPTGGSQKFRLRCVVVPYGMHFSGSRECYADGYRRIKPVALRHIP